jgi:hypothetical protein
MFRSRKCLSILGVAVTMTAIGCQQNTPQPPAQAAKSPPWIEANPNPVPTQDGKGKTTIRWDAGKESDAQVYLVVSGKEDKLFSGGARHTADAPWIAKTGKYEFVLYAGKDHQTELARVSVTGE